MHLGNLLSRLVVPRSKLRSRSRRHGLQIHQNHDLVSFFPIGYNVTASRNDDSYYDLLASEARLASFIAIAKGDFARTLVFTCWVVF